MEKILSDFLELVRTDAISYDERKIADIVKARLAELGCDIIKEDKAGDIVGGNTGNIYARLKGTLPGAVSFSAHMDRMPKGFSIEPVIEGNIISSKGDTILAADDIGGIAAILDGLRRLKASNKPHCDVELLITICEEKGLLGAKNFDYSLVSSKICYALDSPGAIGRVLHAAPFSAKLQAEVFGKAAHAGQAPEKGKSATVGAARILAGLVEGRLDKETTSNFPIFQAGGEATNVVCDYALIKGEVRSIEKQKMLDYIAYFEKRCREQAEDFGVQVKTECVPGSSGFNIPSDAPSMRLIKSAFDAMGIEMVSEPSGGNMDANIYNEHGVESVGVATGYFANHSANEYVELDSLLRTGELVENIVLEYSKSPESYQVK